MKKRGINILIIIFTVVVLAFGVLMYIGRPLSQEAATDEIQKVLDKTAKKSDDISSIILTMYSETNNFNHTFVSGYTGAEKRLVEANDRYHSASIGKTFTAVMFGMLYDSGKIDFNDKIANYLSNDIIEGIFVYEGTDYKDDVTIKHLLKHTSGVADFFEGPVVKGKPMLEIIQDSPDKIWTPIELIDFTRDNQAAVGKPGDKINYSDTGYVLLGLILEELTGMEFREALHQMILDPLHMDNSYLNFKSEPNIEPDKDILELWINKKDFSTKNALTLDWACGGIVTNTEDLLIFFKALNSGQLIENSTLDMMKDFDNKYRTGVYYGMGMMKFDFGDFSSFLEHLPNIYGGVGATGTFMMYDETNDTYIIANFGSIEFMDSSVETLSNILMIYDRIE